MPYGDGIPKINCYSLTDFHDFDDCPFRFFVRHHLDKKYDIDESSPANALGNLLDLSIKKFHKAKYYGCSERDLGGLIRSVVKDMKEEVLKAEDKGKPHFYAATIPFLTEEVILEAIDTFEKFYLGVDKKIRPAIFEVGFCEWVVAGEGENYKLWGGPDTLEMGDDGVPEIVDYKSRRSLAFDPSDHKSSKKAEFAKSYMDMDLMPKIYTLLVSKKLLGEGYKKARFKVRFWQDPLDESFYEEFDLESMGGHEFLFKQKIEKILSTTEVTFCEKDYCKACNFERKSEFIELLKSKGVLVMSGEEFLEKNSVEAELDKLLSIS